MFNELTEKQIQNIESYIEWEFEKRYEELGICPSCDGEGHHGYDEEGCVYVCYGCGGTGKYHC